MKSLVFSLFFVALTTLLPQYLCAQGFERGGPGASPEQRAEQQTAMMTEKLSLSEAQTAKVKEVNLKYALKMKEMREANADGDREAMREKMNTLRTEQDTELKQYLTEEQWALWEKTRAEMRDRRRPPADGARPPKEGGQ